MCALLGMVSVWRAGMVARVWFSFGRVEARGVGSGMVTQGRCGVTVNPMMSDCRVYADDLIKFPLV